MDILEANFPQLVLRSQPIPLTARSPGDTQDGSRQLTENQSTVAPSLPIFADGCTLPSWDWDEQLLHIRTQLKVLRAAILVSPNDEAIRTQLQYLLDDLQRLHRSSKLLPGGAHRVTSIRNAGKALLQIKKRADLWIAFEAALQAYATADDEMKQSLPTAAPAGTAASPWTAWCRNYVPTASGITLRQALKDGAVLRPSVQNLPRGGILIMERWRQNVRTVIDTILQGVEDQTRIEIINSQQVDFGGLYAYILNDGALPRVNMYMSQSDCEPKMNEVRGDPLCHALESLAGFAAKLNRRPTEVHPSGPGQYLGLALEKYFRVPGMRALHGKDIWEAGHL